MAQEEFEGVGMKIVEQDGCSESSQGLAISLSMFSNLYNLLELQGGLKPLISPSVDYLNQ